MSSHLLKDEQFQAIADWLYSNAIDKIYRHDHDIKNFIGFEIGTEKHTYATDEEIKQAVKNQVRNLYNLNRLALVTRYGDKYDREDTKSFTPKLNPMINETYIINTLISLRYQCAEYITHQTELYKELKIFIGELCENIFERQDRENSF
jgi:hypothetical protein